ncbi:hypothetical protein GTR04_6712 [Trichophyton interdigitale]|uniref:Uncharacterized protein n=1 Tax=Trichophyton interdigitale TaxID=101480 RepID=A0A9P4YIM6_9EURO|nr:hypothetical protein GY632_2881 [Trichophyton interdigitale]KAG5205927.1 hypothetical protein GY631_6703 [Trichophyton interdigitale]KAG8205911.1 hypothetical protein GTR04_6712 [Trichophyton interdigitale]
MRPELGLQKNLLRPDNLLSNQGYFCKSLGIPCGPHSLFGLPSRPHMGTHMLAASEAAERGRTERRTSCLAGQMLSLRARLVFLSGLVMIPSSVAWITGPANYNYGFNIQGAKTRQFSLGNNNESAFAFSFPAPRVAGGEEWNRDGEAGGHGGNGASTTGSTVLEMEQEVSTIPRFNLHRPRLGVKWMETKTKTTERRFVSLFWPWQGARYIDTN